MVPAVHNDVAPDLDELTGSATDPAASAAHVFDLAVRRCRRFVVDGEVPTVSAATRSALLDQVSESAETLPPVGVAWFELGWVQRMSFSVRCIRPSSILLCVEDRTANAWGVVFAALESAELVCLHFDRLGRWDAVLDTLTCQLDETVGSRGTVAAAREAARSVLEVLDLVAADLSHIA
jgi:hypothetical protein